MYRVYVKVMCNDHPSGILYVCIGGTFENKSTCNVILGLEFQGRTPFHSHVVSSHKFFDKSTHVTLQLNLFHTSYYFRYIIEQQ